MEDEAGFYRQPSMANTWAPAGRIQPRAHWSTRANDVIRAAVAFDPVRGKLVHRLRSSFTAEEMGRFYRLVGSAHREARTIFLVMDNWPVHDHPRARSYLAADPRLEVLWLPTYAPWLTPTEKIWKWVRQRLTHMHCFAGDLAALRARLDRMLGQANESSAELLSYTGTGKSKLYCS